MKLSDEEKPKKKFDRKSAFLKAQHFCAYQERSQQEVRDKLYEWGLHKNDVENIIVDLIGEGFLNEERFAIAFAGGKFRIKKWGKIKIKNELKAKDISPYCISKALDNINNTDYFKTITEVILKRDKTINEKNKYKRKYKLMSYAISRGFETDLVKSALNQIFEK